METNEVQHLIKSGIPDATIIANGEGCNFSVVVVSDQFDGLSLVQKQKMVLSTVKEQLATGALHAMDVKAFTPKEWEVQQSNIKATKATTELNVL